MLMLINLKTNLYKAGLNFTGQNNSFQIGQNLKFLYFSKIIDMVPPNKENIS